MHRRRTFCIFFVYSTSFFAYIAPSVAENRVWKGLYSAAPKCVLEVIVLVCVVIIGLWFTWKNYGPIFHCYLHFLLPQILYQKKAEKMVLMVVHDWNFLRAEPQIIGISIQLVQHQEKTDKILLLLRMIVNIAQILELIEFKWPHKIIWDIFTVDLTIFTGIHWNW